MSQIDANDQRMLRCRMLGHEVTFAYCRQGSGEFPCRRIFDCWFEIFPVEEFLRQHYSEEQIREFLTEPKPKITSLVELIQKAQQRASKNASPHTTSKPDG